MEGRQVDCVNESDVLDMVQKEMAASLVYPPDPNSQFLAA
jgi:hypothetical protein